MEERKLQKIVTKDIQKGIFYKKISCIPKDDSTNMFGLTIDNILKRKYAEYTSDIIKALKSDLDIVSDIKNINMSNGHLYPDILTFGSDQRFYLFELKVGEKTERETVTELMAYRQEIRNHLPLLGKNEICFIIISEDYSVLLRHAVMSLLYENIPVTCLTPYYDSKNEEIYKYQIENIIDWTEINTEITKQLFEGYSILWYSKRNKEKINLAKFTKERIFAIDYFKNEAVKNGQSGFVYIWDRNTHDNTLYATGSDFGISVFTINSYALVYPVLGNYKDPLSKFVSKKEQEDVTGPIFEKEVTKIKELMKNNYYLEVETFNNLNCYENMVFSHFSVKYCDAWGDLGAEFRKLYYKHRKKLFAEEEFNNPDVFMKLINIYFFNFPFRKCSGKGEYFELGALFYIAINEGEILDTYYCTEADFYRMKTIWNLLFCSMYRIMPEYIIDKKNHLNSYTLKNILLRLKKADKEFCSKIKDKNNKYAYIMGKQYAYHSETVPESFMDQGESEGNFLCDEDIDFSKLQQYFYEEFLILANRAKHKNTTDESDLILLERICIDNDIWNPNWKDIKAEYNIDKRKKIVFEQLQNFLSNDYMKIDKNKLSSDSIKYNLRNLLNANSDGSFSYQD